VESIEFKIFNKDEIKESLFKSVKIYDQKHEHICTILEKMNAKSVIIENDYIDRDYLEDFVGFYSRCFNKYNKNCQRFHFFSVDISTEPLSNLLLNPERLQHNYLGFIVIRPLPRTVIGRTCLSHVFKNDQTEIPLLKDYRANLFGIDLSIKSIAFHEQDQIASACATTALWTAFQSTSTTFQHKMPSPIEITKMATSRRPPDQRVIPNAAGLTLEHMADAIRSLDLEPYVTKLGQDAIGLYFLKAKAYAYLRGKIPPILLLKLTDQENEINSGHALTVVGYDSSVIEELASSVMETAVVSETVLHLPDETDGLTQYTKNTIISGLPNLYASKITSLLVHDDLKGPFQAIDVRNIDAMRNYYASEGSYKVDPVSMLLPMYHKIRIPFENVFTNLLGLDTLISHAGKCLNETGYAKYSGCVDEVEWDIYLSQINDVKSSLLEYGKTIISVNSSNSNSIDFFSRNMFDFLKKAGPRFLWCCSLSNNNTKMVDFFFDATDIDQGGCFFDVIIYNQDFEEILPVMSYTYNKFEKKFKDKHPEDVIEDIHKIIKNFTKKVTRKEIQA
jgi:hypothetical protein